MYSRVTQGQPQMHCLYGAGLFTIYDRCVNALSWAEDGKLLLSGGDDTTYALLFWLYLRHVDLFVPSVRLWRLDESNTTTAYPYVCQSVINTGHTANIFNAQMLPGSTRMCVIYVTVRLLDVRN